MNQKEKKGLPYSIVDDPHMYYFLQSPQKVKDLLKTGLYKLQGSKLLEKSTKKTFKLDPFVVDKVKQESGKKVTEQYPKLIKIQSFLEREVKPKKNEDRRLNTVFKYSKAEQQIIEEEYKRVERISLEEYSKMAEMIVVQIYV